MIRRIRNLADVDMMIEKVKIDAIKRYMSSPHS
ncbi:conserved protein of unknown function [Mesotoga infera]|jgi:hypothetical protein|uniref:Uncharacterized protein n=1 Tax=Mesotoga infera TaxID=1236046 RepID=A0A7Z7PR13_9BACT|nr:conserved protein of unknown function [Mesotoga infera]